MATLTEAPLLAPAALERDRAGRIEQTGIDHIPEAARDSRPANVAAVFFGGNLAFSVIVFGWLPITFGLGWWSTVTASLVGLTVGTLITAPLALLGPRTGTNNTVSSGAHFGVTGRLVGSGLTLVFALAYAAIAVWTSGDALVASAGRLLGTPTGDVALALGYGLIAFEIALVALYGHATVVALQKIVVPVVGVLLLAGIFAFAGSFDAGYSGGGYVLGGFWQTWALAVTVAAAGPLSYAPSLGDYTRRVGRRYGDKRVFGAAALGIFGGLLVTTLFGAFTASTFTSMGDSYVTDLVTAAPGWYVLPILVIGLAGGVGQGALNLYASGLDLESLAPRLSRVHTTLITSVAAFALLYVGTFAFDAVDSITAMTLVLNGVAAPWVVINLLGLVVARRGHYDPHDLQAFNQGRRGGRYWFNGGWNPRAVGAWAAGSAFGLLAVETELYTGPLAHLAGGIDISLAGSALVAGAAYLVALAVWPEGDLR
jgi:purine-cytosine permease-like protein